MRQKGMCIIEVLIAFSIIIVSLSFYLLIQSSISMSEGKLEKEFKQNVCINSVYNYVNKTDIKNLSRIGVAAIDADSFLGEGFAGFKVKLKILSRSCFNGFGDMINASLVSVDIFHGVKNIKHFELIKELI